MPSRHCGGVKVGLWSWWRSTSPLGPSHAPVKKTLLLFTLVTLLLNKTYTGTNNACMCGPLSEQQAKLIILKSSRQTSERIFFVMNDRWCNKRNIGIYKNSGFINTHVRIWIMNNVTRNLYYSQFSTPWKTRTYLVFENAVNFSAGSSTSFVWSFKVMSKYLRHLSRQRDGGRRQRQESRA